MGRRSRHSAKTGDKSIYKSRESSSHISRDDENDDDPMYNEVERYHNRKEEENYLKLDGGSDDDGGDSSEEDDGITKHREGVFDLGIGGSSDEDEDDEEDDDSGGGEEERAAARRAKRAAAMEAALASSDDDDDSDSEEDEEEETKAQLLNWGDKKQSYYHGDTADLEIGQDVEDAYLEEEAGREVEKARLEAMDDADFMLDGVGDDAEDEGGGEERRSRSKKRKTTKGDDERMDTTIQSIKSSKQLSKLSKKEKKKVLKANHPELLPVLQHFSGPVRELSDTTMVAAGALLKNGVARGGQEAEVCLNFCTPISLYLFVRSRVNISTQYDRLEQTQNVVDVLAETRCKIEGIL